MRFPEQYWNKKHEDKYQKGIIDINNKPLPEALRRKFLIDKAKKKPKKDPNPIMPRLDDPEIRRQIELEEREETRRTTS